MNTTGDLTGATRLGKTLGRFRAWYRSILADLTSCGEFDTSLNEANASLTRSDAILLPHPEASLRLTLMMRRLGLIREDIHDRRVLREIELNCALCDETSDCRDWLRSKKRAGHHRFCVNAWRFDRLLARGR